MRKSVKYLCVTLALEMVAKTDGCSHGPIFIPMQLSESLVSSGISSRDQLIYFAVSLGCMETN